MAKKHAELTADSVFGRWTLVQLLCKERSGSVWLCRCSCGTEKPVSVPNLRSGASQSCGCLNAEAVRARTLKHGKSKAPVYAVWNAMMHRCHNPNSKQWADYGGRGIKVAPEWHTFESFYADMGDPPFPGAQLDRAKNHLGYRKGNCRWVTRKENMNNTRTNNRFRYQGRLQTLPELSLVAGVSPQNIRQRIKLYGWPVHRAVTEQVVK